MLNVQNTVIVMSHCENTVSNSVVLPEHKIFFFFLLLDIRIGYLIDSLKLIFSMRFCMLKDIRMEWCLQVCKYKDRNLTSFSSSV